VHQVVLDGFRQVEGIQDARLANLQLTQRSHLPNSPIRRYLHILAESNRKLRLEWSYFSIRPFRSGLQTGLVVQDWYGC
jgi:hypothetical protein